MHFEKDVSSLLQQYVAETGVYSTQKVESDFVAVAKRVDAAHIMNGLSEAFRSEHTPSFGQLVGQSFEQMDGAQRVGMLNQLLESEGHPFFEEQHGVVSRDMANRLHPSLIEQIAHDAERHDPAVIDKLSNVYAEDMELAKTLGGHALSVALVKIAEVR